MADSQNPGSRGFMEGVKGFISRKFSLPAPQMPDREVRDAATVIWDRGPVRTHRELAAHPAFQQEPVRRQSTAAHRYMYGYGSGALLTGMAMNVALLLAARRVPSLAPHARRLTAANTLHSMYTFSQLPNRINQRVRTTAPAAHQAASERLHTEAERVRQRSSTR